MAEQRWKPFLKHPYTKLRDLGFSPDVQDMPADQANELLANIALAAIDAGQTLDQAASDLKALARQHRARRTETAVSAETAVSPPGKG